MKTAPLQLSFEVECSPEHAFDVWTSRIGTWWPSDHTVSGHHDAVVVLQSGVGGRIFERTSEGVEHDWGEVTVWEPPTQLGYLWHIGRERSTATEVQIRFVPRGETSTRIEIEHRGWEQLGKEGAEIRDKNQIGWATVMPHYLEAAQKSADRRKPHEKGIPDAAGTKEDPWMLKTPPGSSEYTMYRDDQADPPALICQVGSTTLKYHLSAIEDLHAWLLARGDWVDLGAADEKKAVSPGTVEEWGRSPDNPVRGWYGLRNGYRGRFGMYLPPLLEALGLAEVTHDPRNNKMRAI